LKKTALDLKEDMNKRKEKVKFLEAKGDIGTATSSEEKQACKGALQRAEGVEVNIYTTQTKKQNYAYYLLLHFIT
jgi:hypothetical protein